MVKAIAVMDPRADKICVLNAFRPYHRLLKAINKENFHRIHWVQNIHSIFIAASTVLSAILPFIFVALGLWYLIENEADLNNTVVSLPILISLMQMDVAIIAMITNNRIISDTIEQIQKVTNQRRFDTFLLQIAYEL